MLVGAIMEIVKLIRFSIQERDLKIDFDLYHHLNTLPLLKFDRFRFQQVLMNLLTNAVKFQNSGRIKVKAELTSERNLQDTRFFIVLAVEDNGIGIAEEDLGNIFKPFRMQNRRGIKGNGVGLSIAKQICE